MFSNNQMISARQLKRLLVLDLIGKLWLLLPGFAERASEREFVFGIIAGICLTLLYAVPVCFLTKKIQGSFSEYMDQRMGRFISFVMCLIYWVYLYVNLMYVTRIFAAAARDFFLPELSPDITCILLLLAGFYTALNPRERRGRMAEVLYSVVLVPLLILLVFASFGVKPEHFTPGRISFHRETLQYVLQVFAGFGGIGLILFQAPFIRQKGKELCSFVWKGIMVTGLTVLAVFLLGIGSFGEQGMRALKWPAITLMSNVEVPGGFLQRFDLLFLSLLLFSFFAASAAGLYYLRRVSFEMIRKGKESSYALPVLLLSAAGVLWCRNDKVAARLFTSVNCYILVPLMTGFTLLMVVLELVRRRHRA